MVAWKKKKGDKVSAGDVIAEIETDKATMEWESPEDGTLTEIYVEEGGKVDIGVKIAFIGAEGEVPAAAKDHGAGLAPDFGGEREHQFQRRVDREELAHIEQHSGSANILGFSHLPFLFAFGPILDLRLRLGLGRPVEFTETVAQFIELRCTLR